MDTKEKDTKSKQSSRRRFLQGVPRWLVWLPRQGCGARLAKVVAQVVAQRLAKIAISCSVLSPPILTGTIQGCVPTTCPMSRCPKKPSGKTRGPVNRCAALTEIWWWTGPGHLNGKPTERISGRRAAPVMEMWQKTTALSVLDRVS